MNAETLHKGFQVELGMVGSGASRLPLVSRSSYPLYTKTPIWSFLLILWNKDFELLCFVVDVSNRGL